eukprot:m.210891 g.210891  ORF g.210891 m.210891 type:complete len:431 (-) comp33094_c0_seq2:149-1441(-)
MTQVAPTDQQEDLGALKPRDVNVNYQISFMPTVDTTNMSWHVQALFTASWQVFEDPIDIIGIEKKNEFQLLHEWAKSEPAQSMVTEFRGHTYSRSSVSDKEFEDDVKSFCKIFDPKFYFVNLLSKREDAVEEVSVGFQWKHGEENKLECQMAIRILGDFRTTMELNDFPFDGTTLEVEVMTQHNSTRVLFTTEDEERNVFSLTALKYAPVEWDIYKHYICPAIRVGSARGANYDKVEVCVCIRRLPAFYIFKIYVPNYLLCSMSCAAVLMDSYADQINMLLTVILTESAYQIVISTSAPQGLPYNTNADKFIVLCLFFNLLMFVICTIGVDYGYFHFRAVWKLNGEALEEQSRYDDDAPIRNLFLILWAIWTVMALGWMAWTVGPSGTQCVTSTNKQAHNERLQNLKIMALDLKMKKMREKARDNNLRRL